MQSKMDKLTSTFADIAVAITITLFVGVILGLVSWRILFVPIPMAFAIIVVLNLGLNVYARYRKK